MVYGIWCNKNIASKHILKIILRKLYIKIIELKKWGYHMQKIIEESKVVYKITKKHISFYDKVLVEEAVEKIDTNSIEFSEHALQNMKRRSISVNDIKETLNSYQLCEVSLNESEHGDNTRFMIRSNHADNELQTCVVIDESGLVVTAWKIELWKKQLRRF